MQTFLPYPSFVASAQCLDRKRLGKQRVEVLQILRALSGESAGWRNHPAVRMWRGHQYVLAMYGASCCDEWIARGYRDTTLEKIASHVENITEDVASPGWLGRDDFHASHRAALLFKDYAWYSQFGWTETPAMKYVWPV